MISIDEFLDECEKQKPSRLQAKMGIPGNHRGGEIVRAIADEARKYPLHNAPWFILTSEQMSRLSSEMGRQLIYSGDTLFWSILIVAIDYDYPDDQIVLEKLKSESPGCVDMRDKLSGVAAL